jgi:hypothetical protein
MGIVLVGAVFVASIVFFVVGRYTATHQEKLDNEAVLQERERIVAELSDYQNRIAQTTVEYESRVQMAEDAERHAEKEKELLANEYAERQRALEVEFQKLREDQQRSAQERQARLDEEYEQAVQEKQEQMDVVSRKLAALKATRDAAIRAARKEQEVSDSPQTYNIQLEPDDKSDIQYIQSIMGRLHNPIVLGKYIWTTYYQKKYKVLAANVLGDEEVCGIYKLTNQLTKECYIGQSKNCAKRLSEHLRCACGAVAASKSNKLYEAMRQDGITNFSFELLERCEPEDLDEKEAFFISLYSADTLGYNSTSGNTKRSEQS